jgi:DNA-binding NtrC family response regulator
VPGRIDDAATDDRATAAHARAPSAHPVGSPATARPHLIALSEDPALLEALSAITQLPVHLCLSPSVDRFIDQIVANAGALALIDAAAAPADLREFIVQLRTQFPALVILLAGSGHLQAPLTAALNDGSVFRFVHKPASAQRLTLFVEAALHRHGQMRDLALTQRQAALDARKHSRSNVTRFAWIGALAALTALLCAWLLRHSAR